MNRRSVGPRARRFGLVALTMAGAACATARRGPVQPPATVVFDNESLDQATVYVIAAGVEFRRIGVVMPGRTETLTIPADMASRGTLNILARLLARNELPQTGSVTINPGDRYLVRLTNDARTLSFLPAAPDGG